MDYNSLVDLLAWARMVIMTGGRAQAFSPMGKIALSAQLLDASAVLSTLVVYGAIRPARLERQWTDCNRGFLTARNISVS